MDPQIISSLVAVVGTLTGALIGNWSRQQTKKLAKLELKVERLVKEIEARQAEEEVAASWLAEIGVASSTHAAKLSLRQRTEDKYHVRPSMSPSDLRG